MEVFLADHTLDRLKEKLGANVSIEEIIKSLNKGCSKGYKFKLGDDNRGDFKLYIPALGSCFHVRRDQEECIAISVYPFLFKEDKYTKPVNINYRYRGKRS